MEQKLLKVFQLADRLNTKQSKIYAEINYTANDSQKLEISIRRKKDFSYIEKCEICIQENSEIRWDNIITLFETFIGGVKDE